MVNQKTADKSKLSRTELGFLILTATVTITIVSTCSPLYPFNPWDDANCFFTVGRGILHGLVPYRDLYEQKGPVLYFIYALAALISEKSFIGAWLVECVMASVFAVFSWKTAKLFTEPSKFAMALVPLFLGLTYTTRLFNFGGNAEEICFPLLTVALYFGLRSIVTGDGLPSNTEALICGIFTAVLFWIKYTFIGFMAGFCIYILILAVKHKSFARLWSLVWRFIAGFFILTVPVLIYFLANGALKYLWEGYFYNNIFLYHAGKTSSGPSSIPVIRNIYVPLYCTFVLGRSYPKFGVMLLCSLVSLVSVVIFEKAYRKKILLLFALTFCLTIGIVFNRNSFIYYYEYILAYCFSILLIPSIKAVNGIEKIFKQNPVFMQGLLAFLLMVFYAVSLLLSKNTYLFMQKKDFLAQYRYAEIINQTPNAKILTYDVMDSGFYTSAGLLPSNRFFCYLNIESNYPAILEEQDRLIKEGYFDYIITTFFCENDWDNYELICEETDPYVDYTGKSALDGYRLYKRI